jgi:hypothetical protein
VPWVQLIWATYYQNKVPHLAPVKGSFWWKDILKLNVKFRDIAHCLPGMGDTVSLWEDTIEQQPFLVIYPNLYEYVINKKISVKAALIVSEQLQMFRLPMSRLAYNEYLVFREELESLRIDNDQTDVWVCNWNGGLYSSSRYYKHHYMQIVPPTPLCWIWKSKMHAKNKSSLLGCCWLTGSTPEIFSEEDINILRKDTIVFYVMNR